MKTFAVSPNWEIIGPGGPAAGEEETAPDAFGSNQILVPGLQPVQRSDLKGIDEPLTPPPQVTLEGARVELLDCRHQPSHMLSCNLRITNLLNAFGNAVETEFPKAFNP